jgi:hypothetical protein
MDKGLGFRELLCDFSPQDFFFWKEDEKPHWRPLDSHQVPICVGQDFGMLTHYYLLKKNVRKFFCLNIQCNKGRLKTLYTSWCYEVNNKWSRLWASSNQCLKYERMHLFGHIEWFPRTWECYNVVISLVVENVFLRHPNPLLWYDNVGAWNSKVWGILAKIVA